MDKTPIDEQEDRIDAEERDPVRCSGCGNPVAEPEAVVSIGGEPPVRVQVNPHGVAFEVVTLSQAGGLVYVGTPQAEHSWFAGYAWTIACCASCSAHLGWRFDPVAGGTSFHGLVVGRITGI